MAPPATNESPLLQAAALNDDAMEQKIQQCLDTLKGKRDEHKFAGLLMVTKLNNLPWERLQQVRQQVVTTVGVKFFLRLLHTKGAEGDALSPFQTLGLNLIASFCTDTTVAEQFADENLVRFLLDQLEATPQLAQHVQEDCVRTLNGIVDTAKGTQLFLNESIPTRVCDAIKTLTAAATDDSNAGEETKTADKPALTETTAIEALWSLVEKLSRSSEFWNMISSDSLAFLSTSLANTIGKVALSVLAVWNNYLALVDDKSLSFALQTTELDVLRVGVYQFLRAKWPHQERDECLKFIYRLMKHTGTSWMVAEETPSHSQQQDVSRGRFMLFVLKLVSIEIKLMLDDVELTLVQMEDKKLEQVEESERQAREIQRVLHVLPVCYGIVEMIIDALVASVENEDDDDESGNTSMLPYEILLEMKQSFGQAFAVILEFLTLAREYMKTHRYRELLERSEDSVYQLDAVVYASVRVVSAWIAEDSDSCMDQLVDLVPFLVLYEPLTQTSVAPSGSTVATGANEESDVDSDDELDSDDEMESPGSGSMVPSGESTTIDQLHFLLPGLLQISATREGAMAMAQDLAVLRRVLRFCCSLCASLSDGANEQMVSLPTLTLALGMLVNLLLVFNEGDEEQSVVMANSKDRLPNASEWLRALSFLLPLACASGSDVMNDQALSMEDQGEDDRYVMLLHVVCAVLLIASHSDKNLKREASTNKNAVAKLVAPFNAVVSWLASRPPDPSSESSMDLFELVRILAMRTALTPQMLL
uniref:Neurochondrin n=1 Tax=Globisporangium ultimum (strain ATCC 200006 / CBS 805.95 / DAOM BR144) TaxID=431595 RepID=K3WK99_GLOUD